MANVLVAQIAREDQDPPRRSSAAGLPALQHVTGMGMTQIMDSRRTAWMGQRSAQACKNRVDRTIGQGRAPFGGEETLRQWKVALPSPTVGLERGERCRMQRNPTRLVELAVADE